MLAEGVDSLHEEGDREVHGPKGTSKLPATSRAVRFPRVDDGQGACTEHAAISPKANLPGAFMHKHQLIFIVEVRNELIG